jgi:hypothetical protein
LGRDLLLYVVTRILVDRVVLGFRALITTLLRAACLYLKRGSQGGSRGKMVDPGSGIWIVQLKRHSHL